jgi:multicomponent Na+:H+ antiporter subunit B
LKIFGSLVVIILGILLLIASRDFPNWADPESPASLHVSPHYITDSIIETSVPNIVTSVLGDYRGFDTMFETAVIFTAGIAVVILLRVFKKKEKIPFIKVEEVDSQPDLIIRTVTRLMLPFIQIFALYVVAHGHHSPGGGFQGGVILGASYILLGISFNLKAMLRRISEKNNILFGNIGVLIFAGIGVLSILLGANFLDYSVLESIIPGISSIEAHSFGILCVEIGVAIAVMAIMIAIYANLSSNGHYDKGL